MLAECHAIRRTNREGARRHERFAGTEEEDTSKRVCVTSSLAPVASDSCANDEATSVALNNFLLCDIHTEGVLI